jgi:hypothetical protein
MLAKDLLCASLIAMACCTVLHAAPAAPDWRALADKTLPATTRLPNMDDDGYGEQAWAASYWMAALNAMYQATGDLRYLDTQSRLITRLLARTDDKLAARYGPEKYTDYARGRVLCAWGTAHYTGGKHTCWFVHAGMLTYPMADFVRIVREGGEKTARLKSRAEAFLPQIERIMAEFDSEWRDGPGPGMGYYIFPDSSIAALLPNNQMNAPGLALFALSDLTGKPEYAAKARKLATFFKRALTHVEEGDYYIWAYSQGTPDGKPGEGEDVSHAAINALFMYVAWQHKTVFTDLDMQRLTRTVTKGLYLGNGQLAWTLGGRDSSDDYTREIARWLFLARFDPEVERIAVEYIAAHPEKGAIGGVTGAQGYAYLLEARKLRGDGTP